MNKDRLQPNDGSMAKSPKVCGGVVMERKMSMLRKSMKCLLRVAMVAVMAMVFGLGILLVGVSPAVAAGDIDPNGTYIEAENYNQLVTIGAPNLGLVVHGAANGGSAMETTNGGTSNTADGDRLEFDVNFPTGGTYYFWLRMLNSGTGDSGFFGIDGSMVGAVTQNVDGAYYWTNLLQTGALSTIVTAGPHTINIWGRENVFIDGIYITTDNGTPADFGGTSGAHTGTIPAVATVLDPTAPTCSDTNGSSITLTDPTNGGTVTGSMSIATTLNNAATVEYSIDGGAWTSDVTLWNSMVSHPTSNSAPVAGVTVDVRAIEDECGGYVTDSITVTVDNTCTESQPSVIWTAQSTASGDFSGAPFVNLTNIDGASMDYQVTEVSMNPPFTTLTDDFAGKTNETADFTGLNWQPVNSDEALMSWCTLDSASGSGGTMNTPGKPVPFIYLETSGTGQPCAAGVTAGSENYLESPLIDAGSYDLTLNFDYNMEVGDPATSLRVDVWNGTWNNDVFPIATGSQGANWLSTGTLDIAAAGYTSGNIRLRITAIPVNTVSEDIGLDNIVIDGTPRSSETTVIPWAADPIPGMANLTDGNNYNLYARGLSGTCGVAYYGDTVANPVSDGNPTTFDWTACVEGRSISLDAQTDPISASISVTASQTGGVPDLQVGDTPGTGNASGWSYNPPLDDNTSTVTLYATGTGTCGPLTDSATYNIDTMAAPVVTGFTVPATVVSSFIVPINTFTATDNSGAAGIQYIVTESATAPLVGDGGWSAPNTPPATYTVGGYATYTLYAWTKDAAGNISLSASASVDVISCTPTITALTISATPNPINASAPGTSTITLTPTGDTVSTPQWSDDGGSNWYSPATLYTAPIQSVGSVSITGRATENTCSTPFSATNEPYTLNYDTRTENLIVSDIALAVQSGITSIRVTMPYLGDKDGDATFLVDYRQTAPTLEAWVIGTPTVDVDNSSPYIENLTGLNADSTYEIQVTYDDPDGASAGAGDLTQTINVTLISWVDSYLLHNSNRFSCDLTGYFSNATECTDAGGVWTPANRWAIAESPATIDGWGVPDAKYGPIVCSTCHEKNNANNNIKRLTATINASDESFPAEAGTGNVLAANASTDYGENNTTHATSERICEVCHSKPDVHKYNQTATPHNGNNCISCHHHSEGFRASCEACHGNPPVDAATLVFTPGPTGSSNTDGWGKHATHVTVEGYTCDLCHGDPFGAGANHTTDGTGGITIEFNTFGTTTGAYNGQGTVTNGYDGVNGTAGTPDNTRTCDTVYCHGDTIGGTPSPAWNGTAVCGTCHGATAASPPASPASGTSHTTHAKNNGTAIYQNGTNMALTCDNCHGSGFGATGHVDGNVAFDVTALASDYRDAATPNRYAGNETGSSGSVAPSSPYNTCSNLSCHWGTTTPTWNSGPSDCGTCHPASPTSGKHGEHIDASDDYVTCDNCHGSGAVTGTHAGHIDFSLTLNTVNSADTVTAAKFSGEATRGDTTDDTCVTICHKDADWGDGSTATTASVPANQGGIDWTLDCSSIPVQDACIDCHSDAYLGNAGPMVVTNWATAPTGTHMKLVASDTLPGNACADVTNWKNRCNGCHDKHSGTVQIPVPATLADQTALGLTYDGVAHGGMVKLKPQAGSTTEAQTCWNCHTATENEWNSSPYSVTTENWTTASFNSPAAGIPTRTVRSVHTGNVNIAGVSSVDEYVNQADRGNVEAVADIRCTYCHDLHSLGANGYTPSAAPYLRGTWTSNPYSLDRPPMSGDTYASNRFSDPSPGRGPDSPRLYATSVDSKTKPGYFIDQNSDWPTVKTAASGIFFTYAETGGLCQICHGASTDALNEYPSSLWNGANNGHANSTLSGTGPGSGNEIFEASRINGGNGNWMGTQHGAQQRVTGTPGSNYGVQTIQAPAATEVKGAGVFAAWTPSEPANSGNQFIPADNLGWFGGNAQDRSNLGDQFDEWYNTGGTDTIGTAGTYSIAGVYVGTASRAHNFSCSKCHDPHASGLPALLTTNCLDVSRATWTNGAAGPQSATAWGQQAAVNCHRKWSTTSENGWNMLSPGL